MLFERDDPWAFAVPLQSPRVYILCFTRDEDVYSREHQPEAKYGNVMKSSVFRVRQFGRQIAFPSSIQQTEEEVSICTRSLGGPP